MTTPIQQWYTGRTILVTGGTGFMGKVLLEKLLRSLPGIKKIFVLTRQKRGLSPQERFKEILDLPLFDQLRKTSPEALEKLVPIHGDTAVEGLALMSYNKKALIEEVSVVFHGSATLKLEAHIKEAIIQNTIGTKNVLDFCKQMKQIESVVCMSTAYCHCDQPVLEEKLYPPLKDPYEIIKLILWFDDKTLTKIESDLMEPHPNSYTFSKRLAEKVAWDAGLELPVSIVRPSIVIPTFKEPLPGWVDSLNGPIGILVAGGKGVLRTMLGNPNHHAQFVPADVAINGLISVAWFRATQDVKETMVLNASQGDIIPITWGDILDIGKKVTYENPFEWMIWYPDGKITMNKYHHAIIAFFFHLLPAYFLDFLLMICGQKTFMVRVQKRISLGLELLQHFTMRDWKFKIDKMLAVGDCMTEEDRKIFYMANSEYNIEEYFRTAVLGARRYCVKEDTKSLPRTRRNLKILYVIDRATKGVILVFFGWLMLKLMFSVLLWSEFNSNVLV